MPKPLSQPAARSPRKRGRPARISREKIARAALEIGVDRVTVTALAAHLGVDHSSLYRYVESRDAIVTLAAELAIDELEWRHPPEEGWRAGLIALTDAVWDLYERHPGLAEAFRTMEIMPEAAIRSFADAVERMQTHGFTLRDAVLAVDTLIDLAGDCFLGWRSLQQADTRRPEGQDMVSLWSEAAQARPHRAEQIGAMVDVMREGPRSWWESKRDLVLDGLERRGLPPASLTRG